MIARRASGSPSRAVPCRPTAGALATLLVGRLLAERPPGTRRAAVALNGLGRTKHEELFVLWGRVAAALAQAGVEIVDPAVGELVTSLDMAGCSLTLTWLDRELEPLWRAPVRSYVLARAAVAADPSGTVVEAVEPDDVIAATSDVGRAAGLCVAALLDAVAAAMRDRASRSGRVRRAGRRPGARAAPAGAMRDFG